MWQRASKRCDVLTDNLNDSVSSYKFRVKDEYLILRQEMKRNLA
jgi:hypothetical protein